MRSRYDAVTNLPSQYHLDPVRGIMALQEQVRNRSTITLHMVLSLDGFIARTDNSVSWLEKLEEVYERGVSEESAAELVGSIGCYIMGSRTYELALQLGWPYGDTPTVVVTSREMQSARRNVEFYSGDLPRLVERLKSQYANIWLVGGAMLCQRFLSLELVDEIRLSIVPVLLGDGLRLFAKTDIETRWRLKDVVAYKNGIVELLYGRNHAGTSSEASPQ